jgi:head-tail adaptor
MKISQLRESIILLEVQHQETEAGGITTSLHELGRTWACIKPIMPAKDMAEGWGAGAAVLLYQVRIRSNVQSFHSIRWRDRVYALTGPPMPDSCKRWLDFTIYEKEP